MARKTFKLRLYPHRQQQERLRTIPSVNLVRDFLLLRLTTLLFLFGVFVAPSRAQEAPPGSDQWVFSAEEDKFENPTALPAPVLKLLAADPHVANTLKQQKIPPAELPKEWFTASRIKLGASSEEGFIVMGAKVMGGANINSFWVFRHSHHDYQVVFTAAVHDLSFMKALTNGLRNIQIVSLTASQRSEAVCKFDGKVYRVAERSSGPIGVEIPANLTTLQLQQSFVQPANQDSTSTLNQARAWLWQQWRLQKTAVLKVKLHFTEGDTTEITYYLESAAPGAGQLTIQKHQVVVDRSKPWSLVEDQIFTATILDRREAAPKDLANPRPILPTEDLPAGSYVLIFTDNSGAIVTTL
jgi:hypothetical protein